MEYVSNAKSFLLWRAGPWKTRPRICSQEAISDQRRLEQMSSRGADWGKKLMEIHTGHTPSREEATDA